jgi:hypothetical protein
MRDIEKKKLTDVPRGSQKKKETAVQWGSRAVVCASTVQPTTSNGRTPWSVSWRQLKTIVEHNHWQTLKKSAHLMKALKGRAADMLHDIPTNMKNKGWIMWRGQPPPK